MPDETVDLSGAWLKLSRAEQHRGELAGEIECFLARSPFTYRHTVEQEEGGVAVHRVFAVVREQPPVGWAAIIGDAVHNLRSVLDHTLWAVANPTQRFERAQYPIYDDEAKYRRAAVDLLAGVSDRRCDLIRGTQPFRWAEPNRAWHSLRLLQWLDNEDKHRALHALAAFAQHRWMGVDNADPQTTLLLHEHAALSDGTEVWRFESVPEDASRPVVVSPVIEFEIGIKGTYGAVVPTLNQLARAVEWDVMRPLEDPDHPMFAGLPLTDDVVNGAD
jgi:hypothetical protein